MILSLSAALIALVDPVAAPPPPDEIVVTGNRNPKPVRAPLGSRIGRAVEADPRGFLSQIASDTGPAGLTPGSGMDPFAGATRKRLVKSCRSDDPRLTPMALCGLVAIRRLVIAGDRVAAAAAVRRFDERPNVTAVDRLAAWRLDYQSAEQAGDAPARRNALEAMLRTGAMPVQDQLAARRTLVAGALRRGDDRAAIAELEQVARLAPSDVRSRANLAALYARGGMHDRARVYMAEAVALAAAEGQEVPEAWQSYLRNRR